MRGRCASTLSLLLACAIIAAAIGVSLALVRTERAEDYAIKCEAASRMELCMERIRQYKSERGIPLSEEDIHATGLIGDRYTGITTTLGAIEAKRTVSNSDMAALMVRLLGDAGVAPGDTVAAGLSGSFPGMNLALLCACDALEVTLVYIASVGASTYGANQLGLTFPDMACNLAGEGYIRAYPAAITMGGDWDCGLSMDAEAAAAVRERMARYGVPFYEISDFTRNIRVRRALYEAEGEIACYVGVGGNVISSGRTGVELPCGVVKPHTVTATGEESGLLELYNSEGVPVINILNIKKLAADNDLPYDPLTLPAMGESAPYYIEKYPLWPAVVGVAASAAVLLFAKRRAKAPLNACRNK